MLNKSRAIQITRKAMRRSDTATKNALGNTEIYSVQRSKQACTEAEQQRKDKLELERPAASDVGGHQQMSVNKNVITPNCSDEFCRTNIARNPWASEKRATRYSERREWRFQRRE